MQVCAVWMGVLLSGGGSLDLDVTLIAQGVIFSIAFLVLYFLVFQPLVAIFEARDKAIVGAREEARQLEHEAKLGASRFDERLREVQSAAGNERDRLRADGVQLERALLDKVRTETQATLASAKQQIDREGAKVRAEMGAVVPGLARQIAAKLLGREVQ